MKDYSKKQQILDVLAKSVREAIESQNMEFEGLQEIRLRAGKPLIILYKNEEKILKKSHIKCGSGKNIRMDAIEKAEKRFSNNIDKEESHIVTKEEIRETLDYVSRYSLYAYESDMRQGFITIEGGHRVGVMGKVILENEKIRNLQYITSVNIRVSHEVIGCANAVMPYITDRQEVCHTLVISPPRCGKTTLIRDMVRQISDGNKYLKGCSVGVVDERSELGGCFMGVAQNDLGIRTDVLDGCPKTEGMMMLIRSMAPQVIAVDEIGTTEEMHACEYAMQCGCKLIASVHGRSMEEMKEKPVLGEMIRKHRFERYIVLGNEKRPGEIQAVYDGRGSLLCCGF